MDKNKQLEYLEGIESDLVKKSLGIEYDLRLLEIILPKFIPVNYKEKKQYEEDKEKFEQTKMSKYRLEIALKCLRSLKEEVKSGKYAP